MFLQFYRPVLLIGLNALFKLQLKRQIKNQLKISQWYSYYVVVDLRIKTN